MTRTAPREGASKPTTGSEDDRHEETITLRLMMKSMAILSTPPIRRVEGVGRRREKEKEPPGPKKAG
ncbi:hypothetical protein CDL15_Pgr017775 [Punica granatum]|uniref:Uncharacterized protein n=1 Tax=Punica granatum TaxID=22663 RepID=A0A218WIP7_PUNGR|nr:hypothetical protein CDL15_Pgr017775 [Punica granatum]